MGAGRLGAALCAWLTEAGLPPQALVSRRRPRALGRRFRIPALALEAWQASLAVLPPGNIILAVPDDALAALARHLASARPDWRGWCVMHTSGARASAVLASLRRRGAAVASLHPMMTFPKGRGGSSPAGVVFSLEGDAKACREAQALVRRWRGLLLRLSPKSKATYHLAATLVGPGAVVTMAAAQSLLRASGLRGEQLARASAGLRTLLAATAANLAGGAAAAWTGPWARGDAETFHLHLRLLHSPELQRLYLALAEAGAELLPGSRSVQN